MPLDPLFPSGGPLPPRGGGPLPFAPGDLLHAQVFESLGNKRYRIIVEGRMLEAASEVALALGQEVVARVRHLGPPLHLELFTAQEARAMLVWPREGGGIRDPAPASPLPARPETPLPGSLRMLAPLRAQAPPALATLLDGYLGAHPFAVPPGTGSRMARLFAEALLSGDAELARIDGWIARLSDRAGSPAPGGEVPGASAGTAPAEIVLLKGNPGTPAARAWLAALPPERAAALLSALGGERKAAAALPAGDPERTRIEGWASRLAARAGEGGVGGEGAPPTPAEQAFLKGDPKAPEARAWADALPSERAASLVRLLEGEERLAMEARPWTRVLREAARSARQEGEGRSEEIARDVPFAFGAEAGVLRVHRRAGGEGRPAGEGEPLRVGLLLSMSRLGTVAAALAARGKRLDVDFRAERSATAEAISRARGELAEVLRGLGWTPSVSAEASVEPPAVSFFAPPAHPGSVDVVI